MKRTAHILLLFAMIGKLCLLPAGFSQAEESSPIVLELFTSQGCSSCPPADDLLSRMGRSAEFKGRIIPLAYHVHYWNHLGWTDPFSQEAWTIRQNAYARIFRKNSVYTPQLVVNGREKCVGSDYAKILSKIRSVRTAPTLARVQIKRQGYDPALRRLQIALTVEILREGKPKELRLMLATFENGLSTKVLRGENEGKILLNDYVVRTLEQVFTLPAKTGQNLRKEITLTLQSGWDVDKMGVAAFLQDPESLEIHGAAVL